MHETPLAAAVRPGRRIGHGVEFHPIITSTNDRARALLADPEGDGLVVVADLQTAGRGRRGRSWLSPPGLNLMLSVGLRPHLAAERAWWLGAAASLAVRTAASAMAPLGVKWPNDLVSDQGLKVAGLLVETAADGDRLVEAVVGIGINVNWRRTEMPPEIAERGTSLSDLVGEEVDRVLLLAALLDALDDEVAALEDGRSPLARLRQASWLDGRAVRVGADGVEVAGTAIGVADDGALLVETVGGPVAIGYGEVTWVRLPEPVGAAR